MASRQRYRAQSIPPAMGPLLSSSTQNSQVMKSQVARYKLAINIAAFGIGVKSCLLNVDIAGDSAEDRLT